MHNDCPGERVFAPFESCPRGGMVLDESDTCIIYTDRFPKVLLISNMPDNQTVSHFQSIFNQKNNFDLFSFGSIQLRKIFLKKVQNFRTTNKPQSAVSRQFLPLE